MKIIAETGNCVGAGQCVLTDPEVFDQSEEDGTVVVLVEDVEGERLERARQAVGICPGKALSLSG